MTTENFGENFFDKKNLMFIGKDGKDYATAEQLDAANEAYKTRMYKELDTQVGTVMSRMSDAGLNSIFEYVKNQPGTPLYEKVKEAMRVKGIWLQ